MRGVDVVVMIFKELLISSYILVVIYCSEDLFLI